MSRVTRIAGSFAIVAVVYWLYAMLLVPWIEPAADARRSEAGSAIDRTSLDELVKAQVRQIESLFPPDAWELQSPIIFNLDDDNRAKLLLKTYENRPDGCVEIRPCTIILGYDGPAKDEDERRRQSVILENPQGAALRFNPPLDFKSPSPSTDFVDGHLSGQVVIRSQGKNPGPEDDLRIVCSEVDLTKQAVSTPNEVDFRWGANHGHGREMLITLLAGAQKKNAKMPGLNIVGIESFNLKHVDQLSLDVGAAAAVPGSPAAAPGPAAIGGPIVIRCSGPFHFDALRRVATFSNRVVVLKPNPTGPGDQIFCDLLAIYLAPRGNAQANPAPGSAGNASAMSDLVVERIEAEGKPVVVSAPSKGVAANGNHLVYNFLTNSITLDGGEEVVLQRGPSELHARNVTYQFDRGGRIGRVVAQGPGWLRGQPMPQAGQPAQPATQQLDVIWKGELRIEPDKQYQALSIDGGTEVKFRGSGETAQLKAERMFVWLLEGTPAAKDELPRLTPHHMLAEKDVTIDSPRLVGRVERLEAWFVEKADGQRQAGAGVATVSMPLGANNPAWPQPAQPWTVASASASPSAAQSLLPPSAAGQPGARPQRFEVLGRLLQMNIVRREQQAPVVSELTIEGGVQFTEIQTAQPGEQPLAIRGDVVKVANADNLEVMTASVVGQPAQFEARGHKLVGAAINLNCGTNRLWSDGSGQMDLLLPANPQGGPQVGLQGMPQSAAGPGVLTVRWQQGMSFDGRVARFEQAVDARTAHQRLRTETMDVHMQQPIRFSQAKTQPRPQVERIHCFGGVLLENRTLDEQQQPVSNDRIEVADLNYWVSTGDVRGVVIGRPGCLHSVHRQMGDPSGSPFAAALASSPTAPASGAAPEQLRGLRVRFQEKIDGNLLHLNVAFADHVQAIYAPVSSWDSIIDTDDPLALGPHGVVMTCDTLAIREMPTPSRKGRSLELEAVGNTNVDGAIFTAQGNRITYNQAKDQLILEGDGRNDARLYRQLQPGAPRDEQSFQKMFYYPTINRLQIDGMRGGQINNQLLGPGGQLPGPKAKP